MNCSQFSQLGMMGLDEIASTKGQSHYLVIVSARKADGRLRILGMLPNRKKGTVVEFLYFIPERIIRTIHTVCSDMYEGYTSAVQDSATRCSPVIVRFHVA